MTEQNAIATTIPATANELQTWELMRQQASVLVKSGYLPSSVKTPEAAIAIMQTGRELGLKPMQSFRHIHIINGKPVLAAGLMASLVQQHCAKHGGYLRQAELTHDSCTMEYKRAEWPAPQTFTFSLKDAAAAELAGKDNWKKHPREMLYSRAVANACRMGWPELVSGVYDPDELGVDQVIEPAYTITAHETEIVDVASGEIVTSSEPEVSKPSAAMRKLHAVANERGITHDQLHDMAAEQFGVRSMKELAAKELAELAVKVEQEVADPDTGQIILDEYLAAIYGADTTDKLQKIAATLKDSGISDQTLRDAWASRARELAKHPALAAV